MGIQNLSVSKELVEGGECGQHLVRNEKEGTVYNYSLFHVVYCLASMFIMMTLTYWFKYVM